MGTYDAFGTAIRENIFFYVTAKFSKSEADSAAFKKSLTFCKDNNLRIVVVCWEFENRLFDYTMDLEANESLPFKIVQFDRIEVFNKEWESLQESQQVSSVLE